MRQRVLIAAAFALEPKLVIADEPTTALDVTVQKQILRLIRALQERHGTSVLFVSHDLGVVAQICDRVTVLYMGKVVEQGATAACSARPQHAYTKALLAANPRYDRPDTGLEPTPPEVIAALRAEIAAFDASMEAAQWLTLFWSRAIWSCAYERRRGRSPPRGRRSPVLHGVDISVGRGETVGIVGESGSGKTTLGRALLGLVEPTRARSCSTAPTSPRWTSGQRRPLRRRMQMIFQDPMSSLNPRHTIGRILIEPILLHGLAKDRRRRRLRWCDGVLDRVGLPRDTVDRYSYELSGGQRQRVGIARAVVLRAGFRARRRDRLGPRCFHPGAGAAASQGADAAKCIWRWPSSVTTSRSSARSASASW